MRYLILGLGIYGSNLARNLTDMGHEVFCVDSSQVKIDEIKDYISTVYLIDVTEEASLELLPLSNVDLVIVAIGENFGASVKVVAMLKKLKVKHIYARAIDELHESILQGFQIDRIITPEQRAARDLTFEMGLGTRALSLRVDEEHFIIKFEVPEQLVGLKYADVDFMRSYKLKVLAVTKKVAKPNILGIKSDTQEMVDISDPDLMIETADVITCLGTRKSYFSFFKTLKA